MYSNAVLLRNEAHNTEVTICSSRVIYGEDRLFNLQILRLEITFKDDAARGSQVRRKISLCADRVLCI